MSVWNEHKPAAGGSAYLKLKDGDRKKVRFWSDPAIVTYDGVKLRYQVVLWNKTDNVPQTYEFGAQVFGQIGDLYEEWGEPTEFDITISRTGSGQFDTSYGVTPSPKSEPLTKEQTELCEAVKFPGSKSKMLAQFEKDGIMPETIETGNKINETTYATSDAELRSLDDVAPVDDDEPISLDDLPE
jgi:hypothetical protein